MEVLRAQIRMWRGSNKTEFQCRSGLFQFLQAFQTFHNTHFAPVRPANDTEFGRAMHVLNEQGMTQKLRRAEDDLMYRETTQFLHLF